MNILVTGGAGYIGSHAALRLIEDSHAVTIVDDLSRGNIGAIDALRKVGPLSFVECDVADRATMEKLLRAKKIEAVMHFAASAYVGESVQMPLKYYRNNAAAAVSLLESMEAAGVKRMVFSSTCATYGEPDSQHIPIAETCPQNPINPYGRSKLHIEHVLFDYAQMKKNKGEDFAFAALRYFNVAGSDQRGRLGEDHKPETHLIPICLEAALHVNGRDAVTIFGTDYPTPDGTCIRDYVHVEDLIDAHVTVLQSLNASDARTYNVGIGKGYSVLEVIQACQRVTGKKFKVIHGPRREGDPPALYANPAKIKRELHWTAQHTDLDKIIESAWNWKRAHVHGYST